MGESSEERAQPKRKTEPSGNGPGQEPPDYSTYKDGRSEKASDSSSFTDRAAHESSVDDVPPLPSSLSAAAFTPLEQAGNQVGAYELIEKIGEGGFGIVFSAHQLEPIKRTVAVKILNAASLSHEAQARFQGERQALALMKHRNIATIYDAGTTPSGRAYFVMELVDGPTITEYVAAAKPTLRELIRMFHTVCEAIGHAHQKGIIHRDIKPSNVLVAQDQPKVIDFGIAKVFSAAEEAANDKPRTLFTQFGQFIGTPVYMSPEQTLLDPRQVDTRTDVYQLGLLLYQLLTGRTAVEAPTSADGSWDSLLKVIREQPVGRPSNRLNSLLRESEKTVGFRADFLRGMRSDLDWIVQKSLAKEPDLRYQSPTEMARDLQRFLDGEPVLASPPSFTYVSKKFVRRYRSQLLVLAGLLAILTSASVFSFRMASVAEEERAKVAAREVELQQTNARLQDSTKTSVRAFKDATLGLRDSIYEFREKIRTVPEAVESGLIEDLQEVASQRIDSVAKTLLDAEIMEVDFVESQNRLAEMYLSFFGNVKAAGQLFTEAQALATQMVAQDAGNEPAIICLAQAIKGLGDCAKNEGEEEVAGRRYAEAIATLSQLPDAADGGKILKASLLITLADSHYYAGELASAEEKYKSVQELLANDTQLGESDPSQWKLYLAFASEGLSLISRQRKDDEAAWLHSKTAEKKYRELGQETSTKSLSGLARILELQGKILSAAGNWEKAESCYLESLAASKQLSIQEPLNALHLYNYGCAHFALADFYSIYKNDPRQAIKHQSEDIRLVREFLERSPDDKYAFSQLVKSMTKLGGLYRQTEDPEKARSTLQDAIKLADELAKTLPNAGAERNANIAYQLAMLEFEQQNFEQSVTHFERYRSFAEGKLVSGTLTRSHADFATMLVQLATAQEANGDLPEAELSLREAIQLTSPIALRKNATWQDKYDHAYATHRLAVLVLSQTDVPNAERDERAEQLLRIALETLDALEPENRRISKVEQLQKEIELTTTSRK